MCYRNSGISRSDGAKQFFRDLGFYKHFAPPGLKTEPLYKREL